MRLTVFLSALLLAGVFGLTMIAIFTTLASFVLAVVLAVIYAIFIIVAISVAIATICRRRRSC